MCLHAGRVSFSLSLSVSLSPPLSLTNPQAESALQGMLLICLSIRTTPFSLPLSLSPFPFLSSLSLRSFPFLFASLFSFMCCFSLIRSPFHSKCLFTCCGLLTLRILTYFCSFFPLPFLQGSYHCNHCNNYSIHLLKATDARK